MSDIALDTACAFAALLVLALLKQIVTRNLIGLHHFIKDNTDA